MPASAPPRIGMPRAASSTRVSAYVRTCSLCCPLADSPAAPFAQPLPRLRVALLEADRARHGLRHAQVRAAVDDGALVSLPDRSPGADARAGGRRRPEPTRGGAAWCKRRA